MLRIKFKTPPRLRGQREISVVCFQRTLAALVYNLQASLHCTRWHGRSAPPKNHQLRLALRKRLMRRVLWYFLSAQKVRINKSTVLFATKFNGKIYSKYTYFLVFSVLFTLAVCCYYHSRCFYYVLLAAKRTKSPGTRDVAVGCCFVRKLPLGNISQSLPTLSRKSFRLLFGCCGTLSVSCTLYI